MKYKKIIIQTDGTSMGTKVLIDGVQLEFVQRLDFSIDINTVYNMINIQVAKQKNGKIDFKRVKVRNAKTEKFDLQDKITSVPLSLERDV